MNNNEHEVNDAFNQLVKIIASIPFLRVLNSFNAKIEKLDKFYYMYDWSEIVVDFDIFHDSIFSCSIRFECTDFDKLVNILNLIPVSIEKSISLDKIFIFLPDDGYDKDEDKIYELKISIFPIAMKNKYIGRKLLNDYLSEISQILKKHCSK
jgi:glycyl-tRNA synthetase (class II)